ncbi:MAG: 4Fe-4S binding protein [Lachnospiraceae bacterium]|nr:4Fe-4S binding protein [Lachnospiraceae bacterium]
MFHPDKSLRELAGGLFFWKLGILPVQVHWEKEQCTSCLSCEKACPVSLSVSEISKSAECIRCGKCVDACPQKCLYFNLYRLIFFTFAVF